MQSADNVHQDQKRSIFQGEKVEEDLDDGYVDTSSEVVVPIPSNLNSLYTSLLPREESTYTEPSVLAEALNGPVYQPLLSEPEQSDYTKPDMTAEVTMQDNYSYIPTVPENRLSRYPKTEY